MRNATRAGLILGFLAATLAAGGRFAQQAPEQPAVRDAGAPSPNVVVFLIDTLRADRLGTYGYNRPTSPKIDALARESVLFEQAAAPAPWTLPSVASLHTSTWPCEHGLQVDGEKLAPGLVPMAERFKQLGYATASFHGNAYSGKLSGLDRGFDTCEFVNGTRGPRVAKWLKANPGRPFFLYVHNVEPHDPYRTPPWVMKPFGDVSKAQREAIKQGMLGYRESTRVDFMARRPIGTTDNARQQEALMARLNELRREFESLYDGSVWWADDNLGSVVEVLKREGVWENTVFIVTADHGEELFDHGGWLHDQSLYQELVHVPLIVRLPGAQYAGRRVPDPVSVVDVLPTVCSILGRPDSANGARGKDLLPLMRGASRPDEPMVAAVRVNKKKYYRPWKERRGDTNVAVRHGRWKGIWNLEPDTFELYDLQRDPAEQQDVAKANAEVAARLHTFARGWFDSCSGNAQPPAPGGLDTLDAEALERLRALGYIDDERPGAGSTSKPASPAGAPDRP